MQPGRMGASRWWRQPSSTDTASRPSSTAWARAAWWWTASGSFRPARPSQVPSWAVMPTSTPSFRRSSRCAAGSYPSSPTGAIGRKELVTLECREVADGLAHGNARGQADARPQPVVDHLGPALGHLPEHPADRLANEEFPLREHGLGVAGEPAEVTAPFDRRQESQQGRPANPEVGVGGPAIQDAVEILKSLHERPRDRGREAVDICP